MHRANFLKALAGLGFVAAVPKIETEEQLMVPNGTFSEGDYIIFSTSTNTCHIKYHHISKSLGYKISDPLLYDDLYGQLARKYYNGP